jgi:hypothetical protein
MQWRVSRSDLQRAGVRRPGPHPDFRIRNSRGSVSAKSLRTTDLQEALVVTQPTSVYSILIFILSNKNVDSILYSYTEKNRADLISGYTMSIDWNTQY